MSFEVQGVIATDHPAIPGHFPDNPIVPGALILDEVLRAAEQWRGTLRLKNIESAKFTSPLKPGEVFRIELHLDGESRIAFECRLDDTSFASGSLVVELEASQS